MTEATLTKTIVIQAPIGSVWDMLTKRDKIALWFHPCDGDLQPGKPFALFGRDDPNQESRICWGDVLEMEPPNRLVYSFTIRQMNGVITRVEWTLTEVMGGTRLMMTHTGLEQLGEPGFGLFSGLDKGWDKHLAAFRDQFAAPS